MGNTQLAMTAPPCEVTHGRGVFFAFWVDLAIKVGLLLSNSGSSLVGRQPRRPGGFLGPKWVSWQFFLRRIKLAGNPRDRGSLSRESWFRLSHFGRITKSIPPFVGVPFDRRKESIRC